MLLAVLRFEVDCEYAAVAFALLAAAYYGGGNQFWKFQFFAPRENGFKAVKQG